MLCTFNLTVRMMKVLSPVRIVRALYCSQYHQSQVPGLWIISDAKHSALSFSDNGKSRDKELSVRIQIQLLVR